ncbi:MAG TPA: DUF2169 domain-containing protein, partial [Candidatus Nanopelagicales bacterium]|nr:DUF2169 domain-containing protein [Candidatus Nanopelagicales bacterium]
MKALPGSAATAVVTRSSGTLRVSVIVKATFAFAAGAPMTRTSPQAIFHREVHHGNDPARTVRFSSDLAPHLARADVLFTGYGYSHAGPIERMPVRIAVFDAERTYLNKELILRDPALFERMPIVYERAYGGPGWPDNPLGVGFVPGSGEPTIFHPDDARRTAGFGPVARAFPARRQRLGATPLEALDGDFLDLPDDLDWSFFQSAPVDQQIGYLRGDEWIALYGLHLSEPMIQMQLPGARGCAWFHGPSSEPVPVEMVTDTLRIDGSEKRCTLVSRGSFLVEDESALAAIRIIAGVEVEGEPLAAPEPSAPSSRAGSAG